MSETQSMRNVSVIQDVNGNSIVMIQDLHFLYMGIIMRWKDIMCFTHQC